MAITGLNSNDYNIFNSLTGASSSKKQKALESFRVSDEHKQYLRTLKIN